MENYYMEWIYSCLNDILPNKNDDFFFDTEENDFRATGIINKEYSPEEGNQINYFITSRNLNE